MSEMATDRLFIRRYGSGERAFVGLHGWNGTHRTFEPLALHLPDDSSLYALDLPGYGRSPLPARWSLDEVVGRIESSLRDVGIGRYSVVGSCSGAVLGLALASRPNATVDRVCLLEPFAFIPWYLRLLLTPLIGRLFYWSSFGTRIGRWVTNEALAGKRDSHTNMMASFADTSIEVPYRYLHIFRSLEDEASLGEVSASKILVHAEKTFDAVRLSVERWKERWPSAETVEMPGAGHFLIEDATERLADVLFRRR